MSELSTLAEQFLSGRRRTSEMIAEILREAIVQGIFKAGQPLRQHEIANNLGVSRIPVREALRQLEAEGLVIFSLNKGATVTELSIREAEEICEMRIALETTILRLAIPNLDDISLQKAKKILQQTEQTSDVMQWTNLNWQFHQTLYTPANAPRILALVRALHINVDRYLRFQLTIMCYLAQSQEEHQKILEASQQRDIEKATYVLSKHISEATQLLISYLRN